MKIQLPFNLLPHLEGTSIAYCFDLRNRAPENHTVIALTGRDAHYLLELLKALEADLHARCLKWQKLASRSPIGFSRRNEVEQSRQAVRRAAELIEAAISA